MSTDISDQGIPSDQIGPRKRGAGLLVGLQDFLCMPDKQLPGDTQTDAFPLKVEQRPAYGFRQPFDLHADGGLCEMDLLFCKHPDAYPQDTRIPSI